MRKPLLSAPLVAAAAAVFSTAVLAALPLAAFAADADAAAAAAGGVQPSQLAAEAVLASGWLGPLVFCGLYVAATVLLLPGSVLTVVAGALYGPAYGTALVSLSSTLGATAAFLVSRYLARPWVEAKVADYPRGKALLSGVASGGAWVVFLLRLSPLVPFNLLNYALGLTRIAAPQYVLASWAGMLPGTFAYVALGGAGRAAVDAAAGASAGGSVDVKQLVIYGVGAVATIAATKLIANAASKALDEAAKEGEALDSPGGSDRSN